MLIKIIQYGLKYNNLIIYKYLMIVIKNNITIN